MNTPFKRGMRIIVGVLVLGAVGYGAGVAWDLHRSLPEPAAAADTGTPAQEARGLYVARTADCVACHTAPGGQSFSGGYPLDTPFGTILASNITQDKETGIGRWTLAQFDRAVRHGQGSHGYLYPAMPYTAYVKMTDGDIADLWAYMRTVPPVAQKVVENQLPFPFSQRWVLGGWNMLFLRATLPQPALAATDTAQSVEYLRGKYLVDGPGHCAACHTAKGVLGGDSSAYLQGGQLGDWYAPNLTSNAHLGLGKWTVGDIAQYLKTGANAYAVASGPMTEAVENSTQHFTDADLTAIGVYLKALAALPATQAAPAAVDTAVMQTGKLVYESQCIACHVSNGQGVRSMIPGFVQSGVVNAPHADTLMRMVLLGADGPVTASNPTGAGMPRFDWRLSDDDVAAVLTYMRNSWGNAAAPVTEKSVTGARARMQAHAWIGAAQVR